MSLEKPIPTIRKAVNRLAEDRAKNESLESPEQRHFDDVFLTFKMWRMLDPKNLELSIKVSAKSQELKNEMGAELFNIFDHSWINATKDGKKELSSEIGEINKLFSMFPEKYKEKLVQVNEKYLEDKVNQIKNDPHVKQAFAGKEELLGKAIEITTSSMLELMNSNRGISK